MLKRIILGSLLVLGLVAPRAAMAKATKSSSKKASAAKSEKRSTTGADQVVSLGVSVVLNAPSGFNNYFPLSLGYEKALGETNSVVGNLSYASLGGNAAYSASIIGLDGGYRWWLGEGSGNLQGWYAGPKGYIEMLSWSYTYDVVSIVGLTVSTTKKTLSDSKTYFGIGGEGGYQWVLPNNFVFNAGGELVLPVGLPSGWTMGMTLLAKGSVGYSF